MAAPTIITVSLCLSALNRFSSLLSRGINGSGGLLGPGHWFILVRSLPVSFIFLIGDLSGGGGKFGRSFGGGCFVVRTYTESSSVSSVVPVISVS